MIVVQKYYDHIMSYVCIVVVSIVVDKISTEYVFLTFVKHYSALPVLVKHGRKPRGSVENFTSTTESGKSTSNKGDHRKYNELSG